jgi:monovalent cation/hydrogen antiporter
MISTIQVLALLLGVVAAVAVLATRLTIPAAILLVLAGVVLALILFLTFSVILVTLVGQGLMLPAVIRALGLAHAGRLERHTDTVEEYKARRQGIEAAIERLDALVSERDLVEETVQPLRVYYTNRLKLTELRSDADAQCLSARRRCSTYN